MGSTRSIGRWYLALAAVGAVLLAAPGAAGARSTLTVKPVGLVPGFPVQVATHDGRIKCPPRCKASFPGAVTEANVFLKDNYDPLYKKQSEQGQLPGPPFDLVPGASCGKPHEPPAPGAVCNLPKTKGRVRMTVSLRYRPFIAWAASGFTSGTNGNGVFPKVQAYQPGTGNYGCDFDPRGPDPCVWHMGAADIAMIQTGSGDAAGYRLTSWGGCPGGKIPPAGSNDNATCDYTPQFDTCYPLVYENPFKGRPGYENVSNVSVDHGCGKPGNAPPRAATGAQVADIARITATDYSQFVRRFGIRYLSGIVVLPLRNLTYWPFDIPEAGKLADKLVELAEASTSRAREVVIAQGTQTLDGTNAVASITQRLTPAGFKLRRRGLPRGHRLEVVATFKPDGGPTQRAVAPVKLR